MKIFNIEGKTFRGREGLKNLEIDFGKAEILRHIINNIDSYIFNSGDKYFIISKIYKTRHSKMKVDLEKINYKEFVRESKLEKILEL
jgi:hypothetical protein